MVKKGTCDAATHLRDLEAKRNRNVKGKDSKSSSKDKENNKPLQQLQQDVGAVTNMGSANIDKIIQFIEGGPQHESAKKKADKKARQKHKKDEEKRRREEEEEAIRKAEEERIKREQALAEQQRIREELALQKSLKKKKNKQQAEETKSGGTKKKKGKDKVKDKEIEIRTYDSELFEHTIPAMVTIKRIVENNNSPPTVTITLKGSTPDQDKLLYTLVNGHDAPIITPPPLAKDSKQQQQQGKTNDKQKKKTKNNNNGKTNENNHANNKTVENNKQEKTVQSSEIKVQFAIDKNFRNDVAKLKENKEKEKNKTQKKQQQQQDGGGKNKKQDVPKQQNETHTHTQNTQQQQQQQKVQQEKEIHIHRDIIDIPSLKLPPGITITKVSGPLTSRKSNNVQSSEYQDVPVSKSSVIVVDTEKLIQQQSRKKKKKKNKKAASDSNSAAAGETQSVPPSGNKQNEARVQVQPSSSSSATSRTTNGGGGDHAKANGGTGMVKLKNPFHTLQNPMVNPSDAVPHLINMNEQATISQGENGMVTIRRPRPVGFYPPNESPISEFLSSSAAAAAAAATSTVTTATTTTSTKTREPILTPWQMPDTSMSALSDERKIIRPPSPRAAPWPRTPDGTKFTPSVLQGLPGIEITRVRTGSPVVESEYVEPPADVSIIRTGTYNLDNNNKKQQQQNNWSFGGKP